MQVSYGGPGVPDGVPSQAPGAFGPVYPGDVTDRVRVSGARPTQKIRHPGRARLPIVALVIVGVAGALVGVWLAVGRDGGSTAPANAGPSEPAAMQPSGEAAKPSPDRAADPGKMEPTDPGKAEPVEVAEPAMAVDATKPGPSKAVPDKGAGPGRLAADPTKAAGPDRGAGPPTVVADPTKPAGPDKGAGPPTVVADPTKPVGPDKGAGAGTLAAEPARPADPSQPAGAGTPAAAPAKSADPGRADQPAKMAEPPVSADKLAADPTGDVKADPTQPKSSKVVVQEPHPKATKPRGRSEPKRVDRRGRKAEPKEPTWNADSPFLPETTPKR